MRLSILAVTFATASAFAGAVRAQSQNPVAVVRQYVDRNGAAMVAELRELVSIPNVATDRANIQRNAQFLLAMLEKRGVKAQILETGGPPIVYGEIGDAALPTISFYCHDDGQPVDPSKWQQPGPWTPVLRTAALDKGGRIVEQWPQAGATVDPEWRIYARSASDDKAPIIALMAMLDAHRASGVPLRNRIKFLFEGDEEAGSRYLGDIARQHRELLCAGLVVMADGPIHPSYRP